MRSHGVGGLVDTPGTGSPEASERSRDSSPPQTFEASAARRLLGQGLRVVRSSRRFRVASLFGLMGLLVAQPALACYGTNDGSSARYAVYGIGTKANVDLEYASVPAGRVVAHPLQVLIFLSSDFVGWGTYKGEGVGQDCADAWSGWSVYVDGRAFGSYHCSLVGVVLSSSAQDQNFKLSRGDCGPLGSGYWRAYLNFDRHACRRTDDDITDSVSAGGEAVRISGTSSVLHTDVHYQQLEYLAQSSVWHDWGIGTACEDPGYRLRRISNTNVWAEEIP